MRNLFETGWELRDETVKRAKPAEGGNTVLGHRRSNRVFVVFSASPYRGHTPHASPGRMSAIRMEEKRLTALLSKMGFPQILWVVADSYPTTFPTLVSNPETGSGSLVTRPFVKVLSGGQLEVQLCLKMFQLSANSFVCSYLGMFIRFVRMFVRLLSIRMFQRTFVSLLARMFIWTSVCWNTSRTFLWTNVGTFGCKSVFRTNVLTKALRTFVRTF